MYLAISESGSPYLNLATEEIILKDKAIKEDVIFLYSNLNSIIIGRNQNPIEEVDLIFVKKNKIKLCRRCSGGGAVYHDEGNINFSFITKYKKNRNFSYFVKPIIKFLRTLGVEANFKGKNDLEINGFKISGSAQYIYGNKMVHHGTLLFDANLPILAKALKPNKLKLQSKSIKSVRQRVSNIKALLPNPISTKEFKEKLIAFFRNEYKNLKSLDLKKYKTEEINKLKNFYTTKEWNFVKTPPFTIENAARFKNGTIKVILNVVNHKIKNIKFFGDFLSKKEISQIENSFENIFFSEKNIKKIVKGIKNFNEYFGNISKNEIVDLILGKIKSS